MWLLERTIKHPENDIKLRNALSQLNIDFMEIEKRPFEKTSYEKFKDIHFDFVYASTNVIEDLNGQCSGIYFNEENFNYHSWAKYYGDYLFNNPNESKIIRVQNFNSLSLNNEEYFFVRPVKDLKSFSGTVMKKNDIICFFNDIINKKYINLDGNTEVLISPAYNIDKEWRCFIVNKKVVCVSQYKQNGRLYIKSENIPDSLIDYSEKVSNIWSPDLIFTLDVGISKGKYYIIEAQCSNSSGFYDCDLIQLIKSISEASKNEKRTGFIS